MPDNLPVQLLLSGCPICTKCMHGNQVDISEGRANSPVEYHCGYCGNYAIVGVPARWPFMVVVKDPKNYSKTYFIDCDHCETGSSPMQVGESLRTKKEEKSMQPKCFMEGCDNQAQAVGLCDLHFHDRFGITVAEYKAHKRHRTETPASVAARLKGEQGKAETKPPKPEKNSPVPETKAPAAETQKKEPSLSSVVEIVITMPWDQYQEFKAWAERNYRTPELQAAYVLNQVREAGEKAA